MDINQIKELLARYGDVKSQYVLLSVTGQANSASAILVKRQLDTLNAWLGLLPEEERFVVEKHIIGQLAWPYVMIEHHRRWGRRLARDERSLKRYQARALRKILLCVEKHGLDDELNLLFAQPI